MSCLCVQYRFYLLTFFSNLGTSNGRLIYRYVASHNTQCDEGHQYTHSTQDRGRVFIFNGQDDGLGAAGVSGRANVWDFRNLEWVIMKAMVIARGGGGRMVQQVRTGSTGVEK